MTWRDKLVLGVVVWVSGPILWGWSVSWLWLWFVVPFGLPAVTVAWGYGLALLVRICAGMATPAKRTMTENVLAALIPPVFAVLFGWLAFQAMSGYGL